MTFKGVGMWQKRELPLLLVAVYFKHSDTLQGQTNSQILAKLLGLLQTTRHQFLLVGDWNTPPSSFEETVLGSKFDGQIVAPPQTLLSGAVLDYALAQKQLAGRFRRIPVLKKRYQKAKQRRAASQAQSFTPTQFEQPSTTL